MSRNDQDVVKVTVPPRYFWKGQFPQVILGGALLMGAWGASIILGAGTFEPRGQEIGQNWFYPGLLITVLHQRLVWLVWRSQLQWQLFTRWFARHDLAVWTAIFIPLLIARVVFLVLTGVRDSSSLHMLPWLRYSLAGLFLIPALWGGHSTMKYFGIKRAVGGDHFRESIRRLPMVKQGMYRHVDDVMYGVVFLLFWGLALVLDSPLALVYAGFQHAYIWTHFYCTEQPDLAVLHKTA